MTKDIKTAKSPQEILNLSFDKDFNVLGLEQLVHNPLTDTMDRVEEVQGNGAVSLGYSGSNLVTVTKTIGSTSYQKTLSYTGTVLDSVSAWVKL